MSTGKVSVQEYDESPKRRSYFLLLIPVGLTIISALGYMIYYEYFVPSLSEFDSLFKEDAMPVPRITIISLTIAPYGGMLFLISLIPCLLSIWRHNAKGARHVLLLLINGIGALIPFLLPLWLLFITYLPVLNMEAQT